MRKARYDMRQVICPNSCCLGFSSNIARPGYWVAFGTPDAVTGSTPYQSLGRVLGRIAETDRDGVERYYSGLSFAKPYTDITGAKRQGIKPLVEALRRAEERKVRPA